MTAGGWIFLAALGVVVFAAVISAVAYLHDAKAVDAEERARDERELKALVEEERLGPENAAVVESARAAVKRLRASEASRAGWLGDDFDFSVDVSAITDNFKQAYALRQAADALAALEDPGPDDVKLLAAAKANIANLETAANKRVQLIKRCAREAHLIDKSLRKERKDDLTAQQRAELRGKLSGMLYGSQATPDATPTSDAADSVMARALAYREIKDQINKARGG
ncbi:MAG: hypothetical protein ACPHCN_13210 [Mycobacterium sp.]